MATNMNSAGVDINVFDQDLNFDESLLYVESYHVLFFPYPCLCLPLPLPSPHRDIRLSTFHIARSTCQAHAMK